MHGPAAGPLRLLRGFSEPKRDGAANEDRWASSEDGTIAALCDGASVSYDSGTWAQLLAERFVADPCVSRCWVEGAVAAYGAGHDRDSLSWARQAAFDRGSSATLLGATSSPDGVTARILAVGDSLAAILDGDRVVSTWRYERVDQFDSRPDSLSTSRRENGWLTDTVLDESCLPVTVTEFAAPAILLMTDALGCWFLENKDRAAGATLLGLSTAEAFRGFVARERAEGHLRRDDTTLLVLGRDHGQLPADH